MSTALPSGHPLAAGVTSRSLLVRAARGDRDRRLPVWFMRQAGRSLPEYRRLREGTTMLQACLTPDLAAEITLQPVRRHGVDAAVFFSDIMVPLKLAGVDVDIVPGVGPVLGSPVRDAAAVAALPTAPTVKTADVSERGPLGAVVSGVAQTVSRLGETPLVGFAGAPFTLAAYLVEGRPSKDHLAARTLMHADPETWRRLLTWCADVAGAFLRAQVLAGASVGQLFDSWAGSLSRADYARHVAWASARTLAWVHDLRVSDAGGRVPLIHFGVGTGDMLADLHDAGADVVGVDHRTPLDEASRRLGDRVPVQGNIDPAMLGAPEAVLHEHVRDVVRRGRRAPAHIVNLGHGVPPQTDPDVLTRLVAFVHGLDGAAAGSGVDRDVDAAGGVR